MASGRALIFWTALLACSNPVLAGTENDSKADSLVGFLNAAKSTRYEPATPGKLLKLRSAFDQALSGQAPNSLPDGFKSQNITDSFRLICDASKTGQGFFVVRKGACLPVLLQAPHQFYDSKSGSIALKLFLESRCKALCINTVHRKKLDWAHAIENTSCNEFTRAFAAVVPNGLVVQLHGFSASKRKTKSGRQADVILSHGTRFPPVWTLQARQLFRQSLPGFQIALFPEDTTELGAETNVQGRLLRSYDGFLHVELNFRARKLLETDAASRQRLLKTALEQICKTRKIDASR